MKNLLFNLLALPAIIIPACGGASFTKTNQTAVNDNNFVISNGLTTNFQVGNYGVYLNPGYDYHSTEYDLTWCTGITSWDEFKATYHYFAYNATTWQFRNWYSSTIDYELEKSFNNINSTINLEQTVYQNSFPDPNASRTFERQTRAASVQTNPFAPGFNHYYESEYGSSSNSNSCIGFGSHAYNTADGHLHFSADIYVANECFETLTWGNYCFMWKFSVDDYAKFWA